MLEQDSLKTLKFERVYRLVDAFAAFRMQAPFESVTLPSHFDMAIVNGFTDGTFDVLYSRLIHSTDYCRNYFDTGTRIS